MRLLLLLLACFVSTSAMAQRVSPQPSAATATTETLSAVQFGDGFCAATNNAAAIATTPPARFTQAVLDKVRFIGVTFIPGATSTRVCYVVGNTGVSLDCTALGANSGIVLTGGTSVYAVSRDLWAGGIQGIFAEANAGTDGFLCISYGY